MSAKSESLHDLFFLNRCHHDDATYDARAPHRAIEGPRLTPPKQGQIQQYDIRLQQTGEPGDAAGIGCLADHAKTASRFQGSTYLLAKARVLVSNNKLNQFRIAGHMIRRSTAAFGGRRCLGGHCTHRDAARPPELSVARTARHAAQKQPRSRAVPQRAQRLSRSSAGEPWKPANDEYAGRAAIPTGACDSLVNQRCTACSRSAMRSAGMPKWSASCCARQQ